MTAKTAGSAAYRGDKLVSLQPLLYHASRARPDAEHEADRSSQGTTVHTVVSWDGHRLRHQWDQNNLCVLNGRLLRNEAESVTARLTAVTASSDCEVAKPSRFMNRGMQRLGRGHLWRGGLRVLRFSLRVTAEGIDCLVAAHPTPSGRGLLRARLVPIVLQPHHIPVYVIGTRSKIISTHTVEWRYRQYQYACVSSSGWDCWRQNRDPQWKSVW